MIHMHGKTARQMVVGIEQPSYLCMDIRWKCYQTQYYNNNYSHLWFIKKCQSFRYFLCKDTHNHVNKSKKQHYLT